MKLILFCLFIAWGNCFCDAARIKRLVGGSNVTIEEVPYQASLLDIKDDLLTCGATIIHQYWLLTAAHCIHYKVNTPEDIIVRTGTDEIYGDGDPHEIDYIVEHPGYRNWLMSINENFDPIKDNDIALIKLKAPINFNKNQTAIPIASPTDIPEENQAMLISGFGDIDKDENEPDFLKKAYVPVISQQKCIEAYNYYILNAITDGMFCAGDGIIDTCNGDSGGPGVINGKLYGIVSKGYWKEKCPSKTGVYTRVHVYYNWIVQTTGIKL